VSKVFDEAVEANCAVFEESLKVCFPGLSAYNWRSRGVYLKLKPVSPSVIDVEFAAVYGPGIAVNDVLVVAVGVYNCSRSAVAYG